MDDETSKIRRSLQGIRLFSDVLGSAQLDQLARDCMPVEFPAASTLMEQGEAAGSMYCITGGLVSLTFVDHLGRHKEIRQLGAGSVVGEIEILTGSRRLATVTALTTLQTLEIGREALQNMFNRSPDLVESFGAAIAIREQMLRDLEEDPAGAMRARIVREIRRVFPPRFSGSARRHW